MKSRNESIMHFALNGSNSATNPKSVVFRTAALVPRFPVLYKNCIVFGWINDLIYPAWILSCLFEPGSCLREPRKIPFFAMFDRAILQDIIDTYLSRYFIHLLHLQHSSGYLGQTADLNLSIALCAEPGPQARSYDVSSNPSSALRSIRTKVSFMIAHQQF